MFNNYCVSLQIQELCDVLDDAWRDLQDKAGERNKALDLSLKAQEFFFEAGEVESWLNEKNDVLSSTDYGRDRDAATKLLTKHKVQHLISKQKKKRKRNQMLFDAKINFSGCRIRTRYVQWYSDRDGAYSCLYDQCETS